MKALSLHQPWATLIAIGVKSIETRSWSTRFRGPLAIHASKGERWRQGERVGDWNCYRADGGSNLLPARIIGGAQTWVELPLGAIVATCNLVDVVPTEAIRWATEATLADIISEPGWVLVPELEVGVHPAQWPYGDYSKGRYAWLLSDIQPVDPPVPAKGHQGLWEPP